GVQLRGAVKNHGVLLLSHLQDATSTKSLGQPHKSVRAAFTLLPRARRRRTAAAPTRRYSAKPATPNRAPYESCPRAYKRSQQHPGPPARPWSEESRSSPCPPQSPRPLVEPGEKPSRTPVPSPWPPLGAANGRIPPC